MIPLFALSMMLLSGAHCISQSLNLKQILCLNFKLWGYKMAMDLCGHFLIIINVNFLKEGGLFDNSSLNKSFDSPKIFFLNILLQICDNPEMSQKFSVKMAFF